MAAEAIGKSQKRKNKMATIGMVIFFSYSCNFNYYTGLCYSIGNLPGRPGSHLLQCGMTLNLDVAKMTSGQLRMLLFTGSQDYRKIFRVVWKQSAPDADHRGTDPAGKLLRGLWV